MKTSAFLLALTLLVAAATAGGAVADRDMIVSRMNEFLTIHLSTNSQLDPNCLQDNLLHPNYQNGCDGTPPDHMCSSDIYWHPDFLDGNLTFVGWDGMPYAFGGGDRPIDPVQGDIDACLALGNHLAHYNGNGCGFPGCDWSVGVDCSGAVCYALDIPRVGTYDLDSDDQGVTVAFDALEKGCYLVKAGSHVVLVESVAGTSITVLESTGNYPVARRTPPTDYAYYQLAGYTARVPIAVANNQGSDGFLIVRLRGGAANLGWHLDASKNVRWYEFQYYDSGARLWVTFCERDDRGPGDYTAVFTGPEAANLIYRLRENEWDGRRLAHDQTRAMPAGP